MFIEENIQQAHNLFPCWFGSVGLNQCSYDLTNPPVLFSLGELTAIVLAVISVFFITFQLNNLKRELILKIRKEEFIITCVVFCISVLFVLYANLLRQIPLDFTLLKYPIFFELVGVVLMITSVIVGLLILLIESKLLKFKPERFCKVLYRKVSNGQTRYIEPALDLIMSNLEDAFPLIPNGYKETSYMSEFLDSLLSQRSVSNIIVVERFDLLLNLIFLVKRNKKSYSRIGTPLHLGFREIFTNLFTNKSSFLYKHRGLNSIALYDSIYQYIFTDPYVLNNLPIFPDLGIIDYREVDKDMIDVFRKSMTRASKTYWSTRLVNANVFNNAFKALESFHNHFIMDMNEDNKNYDAYYRVSEIAYLYRRIQDEYRESFKQMSDAEKDPSEIDERLHNTSLAYMYIEAIEEFFLALGRLKASKYVRGMALDSTQEILGVFSKWTSKDPDEDMFSGLRKLLIKRIWRWLNEIKHDFPHVCILKPYLSIMAYPNTDCSQEFVEEWNRLMDYLEKNIKPKIDQSENPDEVMKEYLPLDCVRFNFDINAFEFLFNGGGTHTLSKL